MKPYWHSSGEWIRHRNPDGSLGGEVSKRATISSTAYIAAGAIVAPGAVVGDGVLIAAGQIVLAGGSSVRIDRESDVSI
ncbi:hypothetical protein D3C87_1937580 [compost metagenome]